MTPNECHAETHDHVLAKVLVGDLNHDAPEVRELISSCPSCVTRLADLTTLADLVELEGQDGEELLASLDYNREAPGSELVAPFFEQRLRDLSPDDDAAAVPAGPSALPGPGSGRRFRVAAAAAVLVGALGLWIANEDSTVEPRPEERILLGSSNFDFAGAVQKVGEYGTVTWGAGDLSSADRYEITILDADSNVLLGPFYVEHPAWTPTDEQLLALPDEILGVVTALGVSGQSVGAPGMFSVWR